MASTQLPATSLSSGSPPAAGEHPTQPPTDPQPTRAESFDVVIIGTGFSGIGMAIKLKEAGLHSFVMLERARSIGGTWRDNVYPGAACDVPSHLYSFSFEPCPDFSHVYAPQPEIRAYLERVAAKHGLAPAVRFGAEVERAAWDEARAVWTVEAADGRLFEGRFLVVGSGIYHSDPSWPDIKGLDSFRGELAHSCRWPWFDSCGGDGGGKSGSKESAGSRVANGNGGDNALAIGGERVRGEVDGVGGVEALRGKRVAVIGTGASAIQIIPEVARVASELHVIQRTPAWVAPRPDRAYTALERAAFKRMPCLLRLVRLLHWAIQEAFFPLLFADTPWRGPVSHLGRTLLRGYIGAQLPGRPDLAAALTPGYNPGCKRLLLSNDFYPAMALPNVRLHTQVVAEAAPAGLRLSDGAWIDLDAIICATGFDLKKPLSTIDIRGQGGAALSAAWNERPAAWLGVTVPKFPNLFLLLGPSTTLGHTSVIIMIEAQISYIVQAIRSMMARGPRAWAAPRPERLQQFVREMDEAHKGLVWATGCHSWYLNSQGVNFSLWPGSTVSYCLRMRRYDPESYIVTGADAGSAVVTGDANKAVKAD